jgi:LmbE family N-acetylglucosaminyl deacetylase
MVLAPHPDDETVATGGLLQHALAAGAAVRVVFVTSGENNPWPQRWVERRWNIDAAGRERWGKLRRAEALAALAVLGVSPDDVVFLGLPDSGLTALVLAGDAEAPALIARTISEWKPTLLVFPSAVDLHPDHSALSVIVALALALPDDTSARFERLEFFVHDRPGKGRRPPTVSLTLSPEERERKRRAILCHGSQLKFLRWRLLGRARRTEDYLAEEEGVRPLLPVGHHPVRTAALADGHLEMEVAMRASSGAFGPATLYLVAATGGRIGVRLFLKVPAAARARKKPRELPLRDVATGAVVATGRFRGDRRTLRLLLPHDAFAEAERLFVKLERRWGFFDEAGWREVPAPSR